jgi:hypothetical protein
MLADAGSLSNVPARSKVPHSHADGEAIPKVQALHG